MCEKMTERMSENPDVLAAQAVSLRRVADDLQDGLNQMTKSVVQTVTGADKISRVLGYILSMVMLRALATGTPVEGAGLQENRSIQEGPGRTRYADFVQ